MTSVVKTFIIIVIILDVLLEIQWRKLKIF